MNERKTEEPTRDEDFVRRVAHAYEPPALSPSRRVALDDRVRARIARRKRTRLVAPLVTAAAAAALMFVLRGPDEPVDTVASREPLGASAGEESVAAPRSDASPDAASAAARRDTARAAAAGSDTAISVAAHTNGANAAGVVESASAAAREWEYALLFNGPFDTPTGTAATYRADELPDEYGAITDVLLASAAGRGEG